MKRNEGFSLIELVVVIAIMMVLATGLSLSFSSVNNRNARAAIERLETSLSYTQTTAMSQRQAYGVLSLEDDTYVYRIYGTKGLRSETTLADAAVTISYQIKGESGYTEITESAPLYLTFEKSTGALSPMFTVDSDETINYLTDGDGNYSYIERIQASRGDYEKSIKIYQKTGKIEVED